jgi:cathepsin L
VWIHNDVDWRDTGAIQPIQNQEECLSSWAFSSAATLEAGNFIRKGMSIKLSE